MKPAALNFGQALHVPQGVAPTAQDALRELVHGADLLGTDADGGAWLLVRTTPQLIEFLAVMDAVTEDAEDNGDGAREDERQYLKHPLGEGQTDDDEPNGDQELDVTDFEASTLDGQFRPGLPSSHEMDVRLTAGNLTGGYCQTPKPDLSLLPPALRKQLKALQAKRCAKSRPPARP